MNSYDDDFIYLDAYDNYCIAPPDEFNYKHRGGTGLIISTEKGCYPDIQNMGKFPSVPHEWKYLNSGQIYGRRDVFMNLYEQNPVQFEDDDQRWYTERYLEKRSSISLDYCNIFQSVAFEVEGDFTLTYNRLYNNKTHTFPMFIHGNGKTDMTKFYQL
ncbi:MAG: glycosyltransferase domain-containing protein [Anaerotignaceae bacterium]